MNGDRLWSDAEDEILRQHPRDYDHLHKLLQGRTRGAIVRRCYKLGLTKRLNYWTSEKISKLRKLYPRATAAELQAAFPDRSLSELRSTVWRYNLPNRARKPYKSTGFPELDEVRRQCFEIGWTMLDLDDMAGTRGFFEKIAVDRPKDRQPPSAGTRAEGSIWLVLTRLCSTAGLHSFCYESIPATTATPGP